MASIELARVVAIDEAVGRSNLAHDQATLVRLRAQLAQGVGRRGRGHYSG